MRLSAILNTYPNQRRSAALEALELLVAHRIVYPTEYLPALMSEWTSNSQPFMDRWLGDSTVATIERASRFRLPGDASARDRPAVKPSQVLALLRKRKSMDVSNDAVLGPPPADFAYEALRVAYGNTGQYRKTVPSAGALWPLSLWLAEPRPSNNQANLSWYDDSRDRLIPLQEISTPQLCSCFLPDTIQSSIVVGIALMFVCGDLRRVAAKYASRSFRYLMIEAGALLQNVHLLGAERDVGVRAIGGFGDAQVTSLLKLPDLMIPILVIAMGRHGTS